MRFSEKWLRQWCNVDMTSMALAEQLTMAGLEVDSVTPVAGDFKNVFVGEVKSTCPHPNADRLSLCEVDVGKASFLSIVCGAMNVRAGLIVAVAVIGAELPFGLKIKKAKLKGEVSEGMLCSGAELGLEDEVDGIMELPNDAPVGEDLRDYLSLEDVAIDVDLTPNRGDCLSIRGIAKEIAALNEVEYKEMDCPCVAPVEDSTFPVSLSAKEACPQYVGRLIKTVNCFKASPLWLQERLRRSGIKPKSIVVDVTNYVMLELGQPMHAFDYKKLTGGIDVRFATKNEKLTLLNDEEVTLTPDTLVIADKEKALAIAGVMGGSETAVSEDTSHIFLESAFFVPEKLAGKARQYGLATDSSHRFERGVSPELQIKAIERATALILEYAGGQAGPVNHVCEKAYLPKEKWVVFSPSKVAWVLGVEIPEKKMHHFLTRLDMAVYEKGDKWEVQIPPHRFDITIEADLIEEIARMYGYNNIPALPISAPMHASMRDESRRSENDLTEILIERGYHETISYSFVNPALQSLIYKQDKTMNLQNPLSPELSQMRCGLWPGLLASALYNQHRQMNHFKLYETGKRFVYEKNDLVQKKTLSGLCAGNRFHDVWSDKARRYDFFDIKGDVEALMGDEIEQYTFVAKNHKALHPGQSACILYNNEVIGFLGALHPKLLSALDLQGPVFLFELDIDAIDKKSLPQHAKLSKFPSIRRDISFIVDETIPVGDIRAVIWALNKESLIQHIDIFDVYYGHGIEKGKKSIAMGLTLQHPSRTLIDSEISAFMGAILKRLTNKFNIILRDQL